MKIIKNAPRAVSAFVRSQTLRLYPSMDRSVTLAERASGIALIASSAIAHATGTGFLTVIPPTIVTFFAARTGHRAGKAMWNREHSVSGANELTSEERRDQFIAGLKKAFTTSVLMFAAVQGASTVVSKSYQIRGAAKAPIVQMNK